MRFAYPDDFLLSHAPRCPWGAQAGDAFQHPVGMLAQRRRRLRVVDRRVGETIVRADDRHLAGLAVLIGLQHAAAPDLGLVESLLHGADRAGREMAELARPVLLGVGLQHLFHQTREFGLVGDAVGHRGEARIGHPFRMAHRLGGVGEQLLVGDSHVDLAVGRVERAVGRRPRNGRCRRARLLAADQVVGAHIAQADQRGVVERQIDMLTAAGIVARDTARR